MVIKMCKDECFRESLNFNQTHSVFIFCIFPKTFLKKGQSHKIKIFDKDGRVSPSFL